MTRHERGREYARFRPQQRVSAQQRYRVGSNYIVPQLFKSLRCLEIRFPDQVYHLAKNTHRAVRASASLGPLNELADFRLEHQLIDYSVEHERVQEIFSIRANELPASFQLFQIE